MLLILLQNRKKTGSANKNNKSNKNLKNYQYKKQKTQREEVEELYLKLIDAERKDLVPEKVIKKIAKTVIPEIATARRLPSFVTIDFERLASSANALKVLRKALDDLATEEDELFFLLMV